MPDSPLATAHRHLGVAVEELSAVVNGATDSELLSVLTLCEGLTRRLDQVAVTTVATLEPASSPPSRCGCSPATPRSCRS